MLKDEIELGRAKDLRDQQFGYLKALYRTTNIGKHTAWKCQCVRDGNLVSVRADHLVEGRIMSCGCYNSEIASKRMKQLNYKGKNMKDIAGQQSGFLVALFPTDERISYGLKDSRVIWQCECRNPAHEKPILCYATSTDITTKNKLSCGCIKSKGEITIINLLTKNNIFYEKEKTFQNCKSEKGYYYRFDFFVENTYIIEFDGKQHFFENNAGWDESLENIQKRDQEKTNWAKNNNIPIIRIPYDHLPNLCLEDLKLETSKFLI